MTQVTRPSPATRIRRALSPAGAIVLGGTALLIAALALVAYIARGSSDRYTDTAGNTWTCAQSGGLGGYPLVNCDGMQTLDRNPADGGVRGFLLPDGRVTFRPVRWGETPDTSTHVLEGTR